MDMKIRRELFLKYANDIKNLGYKVFVKKPSEYSPYPCYGWIVNEKDEIGYFQFDEWDTAITFSTTHKPCYEFGTGFGLDDRWNGHKEFTKEIVDRCFMHHPDWAHGRLYEIKKWTATEFFSKRTKLDEVEEI